MQRLRIATRNSRLALWQAEHLAQVLQKHYPELQVEFLCMTTKGDQLLDAQLYKLGGKGLFLKELETALLNEYADIAVHSAKDVPAQLPEGLVLAGCVTRQNPCDVLVSNEYASLDEAPKGTVVGTSSQRRASILRHYYPNVNVRDIRGNIDTRLAKLDKGEYQMLILAGAGLERLGMSERIRCFLPVERFVPAIGQGVIVVEVCADNQQVIEFLQPCNHQPSWHMLMAERACGARLGADCHLPIGVHASFLEEGGQLQLQGLVAGNQGDALIEGNIRGEDPQQLGADLAEHLLQKGADKLLQREVL